MIFDNFAIPPEPHHHHPEASLDGFRTVSVRFDEFLTSLDGIRVNFEKQLKHFRFFRK